MKVKYRILLQYVMLFLVNTVIVLLIAIVIGVISSKLETSLAKNQYTSDQLMRDEIRQIPYKDVLSHNGGIQVVNQNYKVVFSKGIACFTKKQLSVSEFTDFLTNAKSIKRQFSYSISYNERKQFWLIVTFPTSMRIDVNISHNNNYNSTDSDIVTKIIILIILSYIVLLILSTMIYVRLSTSSILIPLEKLKNTAKLIQEGDFSAREQIMGQDEFGEVSFTFNQMAEKIQEEMTLRQRSEKARKQLTLDIAHDLKNPMAVIMGYAEYCQKNSEKDVSRYMEIIYQRSVQANDLLMQLFEYSKLDSPEFKLQCREEDFSEFIRQKVASMISIFEERGFQYEMCIPDEEIILNFDRNAMERLMDNLFGNSLRYNTKGTIISVILKKETNKICLEISDNGYGIKNEVKEQIFKPFVRADIARNLETGGSGLGLAIVEKIVALHDGYISLDTQEGKGCRFKIYLRLR